MERYETHKIAWKRDLARYLPDTLMTLLSGIMESAPLEEIRIRGDRPVQLVFSGYERMVETPLSRADMRELLARFCEHSLYAWEQELGGGFLVLPGGYRVGLSGRMENGMLTDPTSFSIRIARQIRGVAEAAARSLVDVSGRILSTLVVSPPGCGKTTFLRDLARVCSTGGPNVRAGKVSVVDTRYELAGEAREGAGLDLGPRTDVLSGVDKAVGMRMMVANLSPDVLVTDELISAADAYAALDAAACGVSVLASAHAPSAGVLSARLSMRLLLGSGLFLRYVVLSRRNGPGTVERVLDGAFHRLDEEEGACCVRLLS